MPDYRGSLFNQNPIIIIPIIWCWDKYVIVGKNCAFIFVIL